MTVGRCPKIWEKKTSTRRVACVKTAFGAKIRTLTGLGGAKGLVGSLYLQQSRRGHEWQQVDRQVSRVAAAGELSVGGTITSFRNRKSSEKDTGK